MDILEELDTLRLGPSEYKIVQKAYTEIERLRKALKHIAKRGPDGELWNTYAEIGMIADAALQQKESK